MGYPTFELDCKRKDKIHSIRLHDMRDQQKTCRWHQKVNFLKKAFLLIIIITSILLNQEVSGENLKIKATSQNSIENAIESTFTIKNGKNSGTGFFISSKGHAITCRHVVKEGQDHIAVLHNQAEYPIGIIASSDNHDLALIIVLGPMNTPFLNIRHSAIPNPGEKVYAIKGPAEFQSEVVRGIYAGIRKKEDTENILFQFSVLVNPGNSGGPLVDMNGEVAGVVSWKIISKKGIPVYGEVFAVPSKYILEEYEKYLE